MLKATVIRSVESPLAAPSASDKTETPDSRFRLITNLRLKTCGALNQVGVGVERRWRNSITPLFTLRGHAGIVHAG